MRKIMVIQHESYEALGTFGPLLKGSGRRIRFINFERSPEEKPVIDRYDALILLGGYMGVYEQDSYSHLRHELKLVEEALRRGLPVLGICLGSQILASVLGATVRKHTEREMGWCEIALTEAGAQDEVIGHFAPRERVFQSHGDIFDVPSTAVHLARSPSCEGQAFRYGKNAYGLQFHLEINPAIVEDWLEMPENQEYFAADAALSPERVREETARHLPRSMALSQETFRRFMRIAGARQGSVRFKSR